MNVVTRGSAAATASDAAPPRECPTAAIRARSMWLSRELVESLFSADINVIVSCISARSAASPELCFPLSTAVRSLSSRSGAATTNPHEASRVVRNVDWSRNPEYPWVNTTRGNRPASAGASRKAPVT